jgi:pyocin large subunit-like protein
MHRFFTALAAPLCLLALLLACTACNGGDNEPQAKPKQTAATQKQDAKPKEPTAAQKKIAKAITMGHAYEKHVIEEKLFPEVKSQNDFIEVIGKVLANPTHHRKLENDREAFYDIKSNTIVIYNPHAKDNGTCFRPRDGLKYYENLK